MNVVLIMIRDNGDRRSFALTRDITLIGRREDADFRIPLTDVSRKHCRLTIDGTVLVLEDLGSSNGTLRNGAKVKECELEPGDTLQVGPVKFVVQIDGTPSLDDAVPRSPRTAVPSGSTSGRSLTTAAPPPSFDSSVYNVSSAHQDTADLTPESFYGAQPPESSEE